MTNLRRLLSLWVLILVCLPVFGLKVAEAATGSASLDAYASTLVGHPVTVVCFPSDGIEGGYVYLEDPTTIYLDGQFCGALVNALAPTQRTLRWIDTNTGEEILGAAVLSLTHEAMHLRLMSYDEGHVECVAVRNAWPSVKLLPLPSWMRGNVLFAAQDYHFRIMDPAYRTEC